ncbi:MAG: hypothetical protein HZB82_02630 [Deltaproteobacteria bacterium]|nr:hypothetical protein [Deltaproteobacteria bacterium]
MACDNHHGRKGRDLPGIFLNDRGSTAFYIVFVIFMAIVVYFKFYRAPALDSDKPVKITAPGRKAASSFGPPLPEVRQAPANEAASMPAVVAVPGDGNAAMSVNAGNRLPTGPEDASAADARRAESSAPEAAGYKVVVKRRAEDIEAEKGMYSKEGSHFTVKFDGGENGVAGHVIAILLEEAYMKIGSDLGFYPADRIEAVLYAKEQFRDVTRSPAWAGALYDGRIKVPAGGITEKSSELEKVLFHEYTHSLVQRLSRGRAPTWLNEGLAQYEEGQDDSRYADALREFSRNGKKTFSLRALEGSFMGLTSSQAQSAYILSHSATRYIIREFGVSAVKRILEALASGQNIDSAVSSSIYLSYDDLDKSWLASLDR